MNICRVCEGLTTIDGDWLCSHCRELKTQADRFIRANPEEALEFFRDLVIKASQILRAV